MAKNKLFFDIAQKIFFYSSFLHELFLLSGFSMTTAQIGRYFLQHQ
jgi:hypothetical protein